MKYTAKKEPDPLSRLGLIIGMVVALITTTANDNDIYTYGERLDTGNEKLELGLGLVRPEHPEKRKLESYVCKKRAYFCGNNYVDTIIRYGDGFGIPASFILSMGIWEAGRYPDWGNLCSFGYASCAVRFRDFNSEVSAVVRTLNSYGGTLYDKYSIWRTGGIGDKDERTLRVLRTMNEIENHE